MRWNGGHLLTSGGTDNFITYTDLRETNCYLNLPHEGYVRDLAWSRDQFTLASAGGDNRAIIWDVR